MDTLIVTAAVIKDGNKILIAQRKKGSHLELKWEFPGGKANLGENAEDCLIREIKEELNFDIAIEEIFDIICHDYDDRKIILMCYVCTIAKGKPEKIDCNDFTWVTPDEMDQYDFAPADLKIVKKIKKQFK